MPDIVYEGTERINELEERTTMDLDTNIMTDQPNGNTNRIAYKNFAFPNLMIDENGKFYILLNNEEE